MRHLASPDRVRGGRGSGQSSSMMVALAWPPPSHIVCSPYLTPCARMWAIMSDMIRAPEPPRGCPSAIAPPLGVSVAGLAPGSARPAAGAEAEDWATLHKSV